jgi:tetratricopeptide (TPR) repeat protein
MLGRNREAEECAHSFLEQGLRVRDVNAMHAYGALVVLRCWDEGRPEAILERICEMVTAYPTVFGWRATLAKTYLELGRNHDARREYEHLASHGFRDMPWNEAGAINLCLLADLCAEFNDRPRAETLYEILLPAASHFVVAGFAAAFWGSIARSLGLLAATLGRFGDAVDHFEHALEQNTRVGAPPFVAQTQYDYARFLIGRAEAGDRKRVEALVSDALEIVDRLELQRLREKLSGLQRALRG